MSQPASQRSASQRASEPASQRASEPRVLQRSAPALSARENAAAVYRSASADALQQPAVVVCWGEKNNISK